MLAQESSGVAVVASVRVTRARYLLLRHKAADRIGPGSGRKSTCPGATGIVTLSPFMFLDRLADLEPPPRKHRRYYHEIFAPNPALRRAVTAASMGNVGKQVELLQAHDD